MRLIGLMSGTSVDAIDAALLEVEHVGHELQVALRAFGMYPIDEPLRRRVRRLLPPLTGSTAEVCEVNALLGEAFARAALQVTAEAGLTPEQVDLIASHGQTVYHQVAAGAVSSTLQLGAPAIIAERTGCSVAADFRPRDMAAGGQGAPLVPYLDVLLFRDQQRARALQNIGGMGNVTYLPPEGPICAFDTGPGNVLIDEAVTLLTAGTQRFDRDGGMALAGQVDELLLAEWLRHPFFHQPPPKSTGREAWGPAEAQRYVAQAQQRGLQPADAIATLTALTARSIAEAYRRFLGPIDEVLVSGGGARNPALLQLLRQELRGVVVRPVDDLALDADAKEALAFALLGYSMLHGWPNSLPAATGATHPVVLGSLTPGANYRALLRQVLAAPTEPPRAARLLRLVGQADAGLSPAHSSS